MRSTVRAPFVVVTTVTVGLGLAVACSRSTTTSNPPAPTTNAPVTTSAKPSVTSPIAPEKVVACAIAYVVYPSDATAAPSPGDDVSDATVPIRIPAGGSLTLSVRKTGHEITIVGPGAVRPCTLAEPDVVLVALGQVKTEYANSIRPGTELFIGTPSAVAVIGRASLDLVVEHEVTKWQLQKGDAFLTNLDAPKTPKDGDSGVFKRPTDGGLLLTRCGVQAASVANTERLLLSAGSDAGVAALPSASIGILTAESIKHAREKVLDCAFSEVFGISCDVLALEGNAKQKSGSGCKGGYADVLSYVAKVSAPSALPPGAPLPSGTPSGP